MDKSETTREPSPPVIISPVMRICLLALGPALGLGIARFGYALVLPAMKTDLQWSYALAGWINTVNALGYLAGALLSGAMNRHIGIGRVFAIGACLTVLALLGLGLTRELWLISAFRFISGYSGAMVFISGGAIAASFATRYRGRSGFLIGLFYGGTGFGIVLSGLVVPGLVAGIGPQSWPTVWLVMAGLGAVLGGASLLAVRGAGAPGQRIAGGAHERFRLSASLPILLAYICFGAGSIAYMTFMFTYLARSGMGTAGLSSFWVLIGCAIMVSPWIWARLMTNLRDGRAFALIAIVNGVGAALPLVSDAYGLALASGFIFGSSFLSVVAATTAYVHRNSPPSDYPRAISIFAAAFGIGQTIGPTLTGAITDHSGALSDGLILGFLLILFSGFLGLSQKDPVSAR